MLVSNMLYQYLPIFGFWSNMNQTCSFLEEIWLLAVWYNFVKRGVSQFLKEKSYLVIELFCSEQNIWAGIKNEDALMEIFLVSNGLFDQLISYR